MRLQLRLRRIYLLAFCQMNQMLQAKWRAFWRLFVFGTLSWHGLSYNYKCESRHPFPKPRHSVNYRLYRPNPHRLAALSGNDRGIEPDHARSHRAQRVAFRLCEGSNARAGMDRHVAICEDEPAVCSKCLSSRSCCLSHHLDELVPRFHVIREPRRFLLLPCTP